MESLDVLVDNGMHLDVYIVGDDGTAKRELKVMCSGIPFRFRDAGRLRQARFIEHMTLFTGALGPLYRDVVRMRGDVTGEEEMRAPVDIDSETQVFFHDGRDKENIMPHYTYLIIGGGMTADAAVHGIRQRDAHSSIGLISAESDPPYDRPPLSKGL